MGNADTPIFMLNGHDDDVYPSEMVRRGVARLRSAGYTAVQRKVARGSDHDLDEEVYNGWWASSIRKVAAGRSSGGVATGDRGTSIGVPAGGVRTSIGGARTSSVA